MTFGHFTRRLHLYLGMALLPWFFMYGLSSIPFAHPSWFRPKPGTPEWTVRVDRPYSIDVPAGTNLRPVGEKMLRDAGFEGAFGTYRDSNGAVNVYRFDFRSSTQVTYFPDQQRLVAKDRVFRWNEFFTGMHARGGFEQPFVLHKIWGVIVDLVSLSVLVWIASGVYMWWQIRPHRRWGWLALAGGAASFAAFLVAL